MNISLALSTEYNAMAARKRQMSSEMERRIEIMSPMVKRTEYIIPEMIAAKPLPIPSAPEDTTKEKSTRITMITTPACRSGVLNSSFFMARP